MRQTPLRHFVVISLGSLLLVAGCDSCRPQPVPKREPSGGAPEAPSAAGASLIGTIKLEEGASLPQYRPEDMERRVLAHIQGGTFPEVCSPAKLNDRTPVREGPEGNLIGVMVAASQFSKSTPREPRTYDIVIKDCRLTPRLVVGQVGDSIRLSSEVSYPLLPTYGANAYNETLIPGQSKVLKLDKPGVDNVMCGFTAPCGRTDVVVVHHPVFAVTDDTGSFKIENFPADETVKLSAWHPLFNETHISVKLAKGETKSVELRLTPLPPQAETPPVAADDKPTGAKHPAPATNDTPAGTK
jgi:hypothetical protein